MANAMELLSSIENNIILSLSLSFYSSYKKTNKRDVRARTILIQATNDM